MTKHTVVAVRDTAAEAFAAPFLVPNAAVALRSFRQEVNRPAENNNLYHHANDYELWQLGTFDDYAGKFTDDPQRIARAADYKEQQQ